MTEPTDPQPTAPARPVTAVSRAARILRYLGRSQEPLGVNRIARELDLIPSTALHILRTLAYEDLVVFEPNTKRYSLGIGILGIARDMLGSSGFVQAVQSHLEDIAATFDVVGRDGAFTGIVRKLALGGAQIQRFNSGWG